MPAGLEVADVFRRHGDAYRRARAHHHRQGRATSQNPPDSMLGLNVIRTSDGTVCIE
jgi:hypothetical protein